MTTIISQSEAKRIALEAFKRLSDGQGSVAFDAANVLLHYAVSPTFPFPPQYPLPPTGSVGDVDASEEGV